MISNVVCVLFALVFVVQAVERPSYIKPCSRKGDFDACALEHAKYAIPFIAKGDKSLKIPNMMPLHIPLVDLDAAGNFNLKIKDMKIYGLQNTVPLSIKTDFEKRTITIDSKVDVVNILGDYEIKGKVLILPIEGKGACNITLVGGKYTFKVTWEVEERKGIRYPKLIDDKSSFDYTLERVYYRFDNLFNGDKRLGDEMNKVLNDNWRDVDRDLKKAFSETLLVFHNDLAKKVYNQIPIDQLFLD